MVDIAGNVAGIVSAVLGVDKWFIYLFNYKSNLRNLESEVRILRVKKDEVEGKVEVARNNVEEIKEPVEQWVNNVNSIVREAETLIEERGNVRCFNFIARYKQSKKASRKVEYVSQLLKEQEAFGDQVSRPIIHEDTRLILNKDYLAFQSRLSTLDEVLKALNEAEVDIIGVRGMGGIGKTTLVKEVGRQAKEDKRFDKVIFVEATDAPNIKEIREEIANNLGLKFEDKENETERRNKLFARLKQEKTILIILDNIWVDLDLEKIGIPFGVNHKGCKLLLTARDRNVLERMGSKSFSIDVLKEDEAWNLFRKMTGEVVDTCELQSLPNDVCKECGGLPIAVITVAKALKTSRQLFQWRNALQELRRPSPTEFKGVLGAAYSKIALSYNYLKREELKKVFLLCSIMTYDASISKLFKFVMGLNILEGSNLKIEEARDRLYTLLYELKDSGLLLDCSSSERFSMHDVVRDIAIKISYKDHHVFTERNDWENMDKLMKCTKISLTSGDIISKHWAEVLECPELEFFYMVMKGSSFKFPEKFFSRMEKLKVLSLNSFPSSISLPIGLQTLCLDWSQIGEVAIIGELKNLRILSLRGCYNIKQLPGEISQLTQLRLLDLSNCRGLQVITPSVISSLVLLEELCMRGCPALWDVGGPNVERNSASLEELLHLSGLTALEIDIEDVEILPKRFFSKKLERYNISVGNWSISGMMYLYKSFLFSQNNVSRRIKMKLNSSICLEELQGIKNVESLCLDELQNVKNGLHELDNDGFSQLKHLHVQNNHDFLCLVDSTKCVTAFPLLESLILFRMINLEKICEGQPTTDSFCNLKFIEVNRCDELKILFSFSTAKSLPQLQRLRVQDCKNVKEIFAIEREGNVNNGSDTIEFFQLRFLTLKHLPRLASFYSGMTTTSTSQSRHDELTLFDEKLVISNLEALEVEDIESEMIWCSPTFMTSFYHNLTSLTVLGCRKLKYIFPASMVQSFKHLQNLQICRCRDLKEIIADGAEETPKFVFPRLKFLKLDNLPELTTFYPGRHTLEWPLLEKLRVCDCKKAKIFTSKCGSSYENNTEAQFHNSEPALFLIEKINPDLKELIVYSMIPLGILKRFNNLEKLKLEGGSDEVLCSCKEEEKNIEMPIQIKHLVLDHLYQLKYFWKEDCKLDPVLLFQNLTHLRVTDCHKIEMSIITPSVARSLLQLREMSICRCDMIIEVVEDERDATKHEIDFPKLKSLSLDELENLVCFYSGNYILKFPSLEELKVMRCYNMRTFSQGALSAPKLQKVVEGYGEELWEGDLNSTIQQIFEKKHSFDAKNIKQIWRGQVPNEPEADQVKAVEIFKDKSTSIPVEIFEMFHKLENLKLEVSSYKELFPCGDEDKCVGAFTQLKILEVLYCQNLTTLVPSSTSFENLKTLKVQYCNGLRSLLTSSTAKSLVRLQEMTIKQCEMLTEVVANGGDVEKDVVFRTLESLSLDCLENLTSFCSGNYNFKFLSLNKLIVHDCPKMETFSGRVLRTPKLQKVERYKYDYNGCWDCDLNTTIKQLQKMVIFPDMGNTELFLDRGNTELFPDRGNTYLRSSKEFAETLCDIQLPMSMSYRNITRLILEGFKKLKYVFSSSLVKGFEQLQQLEIIDCAALKEIVTMEEVETTSAFVFPRVTFLKFKNLPELTTFYLGRHNLEWRLLEKLEVCDCKKVKIFTSECGSSNENNTEAQFDISKPALFLIEKINPDLKELIVDGMIPLGILQRFNNLEKLKLDGSSNKVLFSCKEDCKLDSILLFQNLTDLEVTRCHGILMNLITPSVVGSLLQLREMAISKCDMIIEVVEDERDATKDEIDFPKLNSLSLDCLKNLVCFYSGNCILKFPSLEELQVTKCPSMKTFSQGVLSAPNLQKVERDRGEWWEGDLNSTIRQLYKKKVYHDPKVLTLIGKDNKQIRRGQIPDEPKVDDVEALVIAIDKSTSIPVEIFEMFHKLENLKLEVSSYKELFSCGDEDKCVGAFTQLKILEVLYCQNLTTLVPSSTSFENLKTLKVQYCNGLRSLLTSSTAKSLVRLQEMTIKQCEMLTEVVANGGDVEKDVVFRKLKSLSLDCLENLTSFCSGNYTFKFLSLERLIVHNCPKMETFSGGVLSTPKLQKVERYGDLHRFSAADVFGCWDYDLNTTIKQLQKQVVFPDTNVSKESSTFWDIQCSTSTSSSYRNITHLILCGFHNLKYVFPSSLVKSFEQLQQLEIRNCVALKEIVTMEEIETTSTFVFPRVTTLKLKLLPKLTSFYPGKHTSEWPVLRILEVCFVNVKTFSSEHMSFHEDNEESHSLLLVEKINSNLEALRLSEIDSVMTWQGPFLESFFCKLKRLEIIFTNVLVEILQRFKNLEMLKLHSLQGIEIFLCGEDEKTIGKPTHIKGLVLCSNYDLEYPWKPDSKIASLLQNLEVLEVDKCWNLISVVPSSASFQNLKVLTVANCNAMVNLITSSAAKSLVQLTEMEIQKCFMLIEIVENDQDGAEDEIIFSKLKCLSLEDLESLTCFCTGKYTFKFPTLEELIVKDCPNMSTFCEGVLSTPRLQKVWEEKYLNIGTCSDGELNTIIQQLHSNVVHSNSKILIISGKDITPTWPDQFSSHDFRKGKSLEFIKDESISPAGILSKIQTLHVYKCCKLTTLVPSPTSFENLKTLGVWHCHGLRNLLSFATAKSLNQLRQMTIKQCEMMTEIVANEGDVENNEIVFSKLQSLSIADLKSFTCFCSGNYTFKFPSLEGIHVKRCPKMKTFSEGVLTTPRLQGLQYNMKHEKICGLNETIQQLHKKSECSEL